MPKPLPTLEEFQKYLRLTEDYHFVWIHTDNSRTVAGERAGSKDVMGYWRIGFQYRQHKEHRLVYLYVHGHWPEGQIDHRDTDKLNNHPDNLRVATALQNNHNRKKMQGSSKYQGVYWAKKDQRWHVRIRNPLTSRKEYLGSFLLQDEDIAGATYAAKAREYHGEFYREAKTT